MSETRWTPGPYKAYSGDGTNGWWVIHDSEGHEIGSTDGGFEFAEAHLFAAAPDLYDALGTALQILQLASRELTEVHRGVLHNKAWGQFAIEAAEAALAKARGES